MSDPADNFENPADKHLEYAPRSVRLANQQGSPGAAEGEFPRSLRHANQQGSPGAKSEIPRVGLRPSAERDVNIWRQSLEPEIMHFACFFLELLVARVAHHCRSVRSRNWGVFR